MQEKSGSLAGSKPVTKQSSGGEWHAPDAGSLRGGGNSPAGSTKPIHGQKKALRIKPLNAAKQGQ